MKKKTNPETAKYGLEISVNYIVVLMKKAMLNQTLLVN